MLTRSDKVAVNYSQYTIVCLLLSSAPVYVA